MENIERRRKQAEEKDRKMKRKENEEIRKIK